MGVSTLPELRELAMRVLAEPVGADAGERIWSTYIFIVDNRRNRLSVDRARKLVCARALQCQVTVVVEGARSGLPFTVCCVRG